MSLIGALKAVKAGQPVKKAAPFYSAVDEALANLKRPKGTGAEFLTEVMKTKGVKKAEIADRKLEEAFKSKGKMTKEEAQQVLKDNPPPKLSERELTEISDDLRDAELRDKIETSGYDSWDEVPSRIIRKWNEEIDENLEKYGDYRTPGGSNYREILLKLPSKRPIASNYTDPAKYDADMKAFNASGTADYQSSHWRGEPNVLAHMRVQDRTGPNGEKILHVEEIQSDWHQQGRKVGYKNEENIQQAQRALDEYNKDAKERLRQIMLKEAEGEMKPENAIKYVNGMVNTMDPSGIAGMLNEKSTFNELYRTARDADKVGVPDAPFKKNWHELAMKRLLNYAADNGYDSIAITPGAEQAKRYDLSKQVDELLYKQNPDGTYKLSAQARGTGNMIGEAIPAEKLEDYVGKDVAQKIIDNRGTEQNLGGSGSVSQPQDIWGSLSGIDLQIGGEGMKGFYDKMLPDYLNNYGKPYGAQVQMDSVPVSTRDPKSTGWDGGQGDHPFMTSQDLSEPFDGMVELLRRNPETGEQELVGRMLRADSEARIASELMKLDKYNQIKLHNFPITPEMREQIKQKGLPLYQQIGIPTAGAGAASQMLEQEEPQYGTGGAIAKMAKKAIPVVRAPEIIKPSGLTELKKIVEQEKGGYGARRLERAADEIPNLEKLYNERALREAFTGDNARALMTMNPADFEKYAAKIPEKLASDTNTIGDKWGQSTSDYVKYLTSIDRFDDVPFLLINKQESGLPLMPFINGHEGRHRNRALASRGEQSNLVQLLPRAELREPFPRRSQQEYIEALKQEMEMTGNKVKPELYFDDSLPKNLVIDRPPIDLPDIYAKGGSVKRQVKKADGGAINYNTAPDMSDGGRIIQGAPFKHGGKVNMTTNRDAMFMELSNKKLKRK